MNINRKSIIDNKKLTRILLAIYLVVMTWIILFKMEFSIGNIYHSRSINLIPFGQSMIVNDKVSFSEIYQNILIFVPFGIYISMIRKEWAFLIRLAPIAGLSFIYEALQYIFALGATDITDLIGNTLGGIIGMAIYFVLRHIFKNNIKLDKVLNILASIGTVLVLLALGMLMMLN